mgnify:FL=1
MIRNEVKLIGRLTANPELKYTKETNKALCNVVLDVNSIYSNEAEYLHLVFWNKTAENLCKYKGKGDLIAVTGYLKTRSYIDKDNIVRNIVEVIVEQVDYLGYTKRGVDKSEPIPKLDPDHKKQEEYQMIHDALCADEDLPF